LRKISSDETIWKPIFKERMGWCKMREHHSSAFNWRQQFVDRRHFCYEKRARNLESSSQDSVTTILWRTLNALNPFSPIRKRKVVFVGLEAAGKTTCCFRLQMNGADPNYFPVPRQFPPLDVFQTQEMEFVTWDMGGYKSKYYDSYSNRMFAPRLQECEAIVFVIDAADELRLLEAKTELSAVLEAKLESMFDKSLNLFEKDNKPFPVLLLANKQDLPGAITADDVVRVFGSCFDAFQNIVWMCRATCAAKREPECLIDAVWWLLSEIELGQ
jgi:hypothetical protein